MSSLLAVLFAAMTSADAVVTVLNSSTACSAARFAEARALVEREAKEGRPVQQYVVGVTTEDGELAKKYLEAARPRVRAMAEKKNNSLAWYLLSLENNDLELLHKAAEGGNVQALNALGNIAIGAALSQKDAPTNAVAKVMAQGLSCFRRAAAVRDPNGFVNLGACYTRGLGCPVNHALAFQCYRSAAEEGHPEGMENLSACYGLGHGVPQDDGLSLLWRMRAKAARGDKVAEKWLKERR